MGESGTGKELVARAIHAASHRHGTPMVSVNCPVLSAQLMESELFGHEKGAFTGANAPRTGRFEAAHGGTLLLDEISEIDLRLQAKLLRVLQEKSFERVGSCKTMHVNVRVLATTNRDLHGEVSAARFREDLYFRLAVLPLAVPPLRQRREDVPDLAAYFFQRCARRLQREACSLQPDAQQLLVDYHWPGNVRELENIITRASVLTTTGRITADELGRWLIGPPQEDDGAREDAVPVGISLEEMERRLDRGHLGALRRPSRPDGQGPGHRHPHALRQVAAIWLRPPREMLYDGDHDPHALDRQILPPAKRRNCRFGKKFLVLSA